MIRCKGSCWPTIKADRGVFTQLWLEAQQPFALSSAPRTFGAQSPHGAVGIFVLVPRKAHPPQFTTFHHRQPTSVDRNNYYTEAHQN